MPPRYAYWTIIVEDKPTAFRSASVEEILPTFNRLKAKQPNAVLKWFQNGKLWDSEREAREAQIRRGEEGRRRDKNQQADRAPRQSTGKLDWKPKQAQTSERPPKLDWSPRDSAARPRPQRRDRPPFKSDTNQRDSKPWGAKPRAAYDRPPFKGKTNQRDSKPWDAKPRDARDRPPYKGGSNQRDARPASAKPRDAREGPKLEWTPRQTPPTGRPANPAGQPYNRGADQHDVKRDAKWRPGGEHRDPRQKYKDAKKAKWTRFKAAIAKRRPPRKP